MPQSSLWLIPHANHPFTKEVEDLIENTVPSNFTKALSTANQPKQKFSPHVTLTSDINPSTYSSSSSPQSWLDNLSLPTSFRKEHSEVVLELDHLETHPERFRKIVVAITPNANLTTLVSTLRHQAVSPDDESAAKSWAETKFAPHMSLFYAELPVSDVKAKLPLVESQIGFGLGGLFACCGGTLCMGASLVLVDTSKDVGEWEVLASRKVEWVNWRMSHNLG